MAGAGKTGGGGSALSLGGSTNPVTDGQSHGQPQTGLA